MSIKVLDLFSGIGGFSLGLERAGMETVAFCENDAFCQRVLAKHWPGVPIHDNIEELDGRQYRGTVELVCGGFPCQPFSVSGKQRGAEDDRALWPEMLRVIREVAPRYVIAENVTGIIRMELDNCLSSLEDSGYSCQTFVIPACAVDAQHRRDRVWVIAQKNDSDSNRQRPHRKDKYEQRKDELADRQISLIGSVCEVLAGQGNTEERNASDVANTISATGRGRGLYRDTSDQGREASRAGATRLQPEDWETQPGHPESGSETMADADSNDGRGRSGSQPRGRHSRVEHSGSSPRQHKQVSNEDVAHPPSSRQSGQGEHEHPGNQEAHREREASHALDVGVRKERVAQPGMGGMADGVSRWLDEPEGIPRVIGKVPDRTHRLKALGNAVVPQVVEVLGRMVMEMETEKSNP